jgi:tetratricopeptide (TPR) repeat protein
MGTVELDLGRYDAALKSLASALALYRVLLGDETVQVATTLYALGVVYEAKRVYPESMKYHKEAFRLRRRLLGPDDLLVAQSLDKVSQLLHETTQFGKGVTKHQGGVEDSDYRIWETITLMSVHRSLEWV